MVEIAPLRAEDRGRWEVLARGYKDFYGTTESDQTYADTWRRLMLADELHGRGAWLDGELVGISHYLFHATVWTAGACYLQDLFVDPTARGHGAARSLIAEVARDAAERNLPRLYWHTQQANADARALYDKVARFEGFICYDKEL